MPESNERLEAAVRKTVMISATGEAGKTFFSTETHLKRSLSDQTRVEQQKRR